MITTRQYAAGEVIIRENEFGETAYVIEKGSVEVTKEIGGKKVFISTLGQGGIFGEMSMVDEKPRSATVTAVAETAVREIHRDKFYALMQEQPAEFTQFLKVIFERLREANMRLARIPVDGKSSATAAPASAKPQDSKDWVLRIEGLTPRAIEALPDHPYFFWGFPLNIGRKTDDPLANNGLEIADQQPLQISRTHATILLEHGKIGVYDRGSQLGLEVNDQRIGGRDENAGPVFFDGVEGTVLLGLPTSPYRYKVTALPAEHYLALNKKKGS